MTKPMIIIAADDVTLRQRLQVLLRRGGYDAVATSDADGVLQVMRQRQTALVILGTSPGRIVGWTAGGPGDPPQGPPSAPDPETARSSEELAIATLRAGINVRLSIE